jgi:ribosomal protein S17
MRIEKKCHSQYFQKILSGEKTFELRLADFSCKPGDILVLKEYDPKTKTYSGRVLEKEVTYVLKTNDISFWPKEDIEKYGLQVISFR